MLDEANRQAGLRHLQRGVQLERANRMKEAAAAYRLAVDNDPSLREAHTALGSYYHRNGLLAKAADELHAVANLGGDALSYFNLGYVLVELERYDEALEMFGRCLRLDPQDASARYEMAYVKFLQGHHNEALLELDQPTHAAHDEWEAHNLRGICLLGLRRYDEALVAFGHALLLTDDIQAQVTLLERVVAVERHREFRRLRSMKDQLYAEDGVVCLGSAQDDGLVVNEAHDYHFTYPDIGTTLQRLLGLMRSGQAQLSAVVSLDVTAQPLADALSVALGFEPRRFNDLRADDTVLLVLGVAREAELLSLAVERVPCPAVCFCLGLNWLRHSRLLPDIAGVVVHGGCSVPWEPELRRLRSSGAPASAIAACLDEARNQVAIAVRDTPPDANLARQIRYYTRLHRRLSFPL